MKINYDEYQDVGWCATGIYAATLQNLITILGINQIQALRIIAESRAVREFGLGGFMYIPAGSTLTRLILRELGYFRSEEEIQDFNEYPEREYIERRY